MTTTPVTSWADVASRLASSRNYWLATVDEDGAPHTVPVWGAVVDDALHLYTSRTSAKARHLARNPRVALHLENAEDVVIVDGRLEDLGQPSDHPDVLAALEAKYPDDADYLPSHDPYYDALFRLQPTSAKLWLLADFDGSQRRWRAGD